MICVIYYALNIKQFKDMWKKHGHEKLISDGYGGFGTKEELEKRSEYLKNNHEYLSSVTR